MPATVYVVELPSVFLARGCGEGSHQDIRDDVWLTHNAPQALAALVILGQNWCCCMVVDRVEKIRMKRESSSEVEAK